MRIATLVTTLSFIAFGIHLVWENVQAPLFAGFSSFGQHFFICFLGTIGDVIFTVVVYLIISVLKSDFGWVVRLNKADILVLAIVGFFFALGIEWRALLSERWAYADSMPLLPYFHVGLTPVLQMTLLLPLSFYLTSKWSTYHSARQQ